MNTNKEYTCPSCKNPIYDEEALLCHFCGESLRRGRGFLGTMKYPTPKLIIVAIVLILIATFVVTMFR